MKLTIISNKGERKMNTIISAGIIAGCLLNTPAAATTNFITPAPACFVLVSSAEGIEDLLTASSEDFVSRMEGASLSEVQELMESCTWQQAYYLSYRMLRECPEVQQAVGREYVSFYVEWQKNFTEQFMSLSDDEQHAMAMESMTGRYSGKEQSPAPAPALMNAKTVAPSQPAAQNTPSYTFEDWRQSKRIFDLAFGIIVGLIVIVFIFNLVYAIKRHPKRRNQVRDPWTAQFRQSLNSNDLDTFRNLLSDTQKTKFDRLTEKEKYQMLATFGKSAMSNLEDSQKKMQEEILTAGHKDSPDQKKMRQQILDQIKDQVAKYKQDPNGFAQFAFNLLSDNDADDWLWPSTQNPQFQEQQRLFMEQVQREMFEEQQRLFMEQALNDATQFNQQQLHDLAEEQNRFQQTTNDWQAQNNTSQQNSFDHQFQHDFNNHDFGGGFGGSSGMGF